MSESWIWSWQPDEPWDWLYLDWYEWGLKASICGMPGFRGLQFRLGPLVLSIGMYHKCCTKCKDQDDG